jgi:hypothetical protein
MKWKHFISPSLCIKMLYIKNMKSWEKSMATASPAAAVFFWKFLSAFRVVLGLFQVRPLGKFLNTRLWKDSEMVCSTV